MQPKIRRTQRKGGANQTGRARNDGTKAFALNARIGVKTNTPCNHFFSIGN
jgi:hypothetical protein